MKINIITDRSTGLYLCEQRVMSRNNFLSSDIRLARKYATLSMATQYAVYFSRSLERQFIASVVDLEDE